MKTAITRLPLSLVLGATLLVGGCGSHDGDDGSRSVVQKVTDRVEEKVRHEMATQNLRLNGDGNGQPRAELAPDGTLLIGGVAVPMTDAQRALALRYRSELAAIAEAGAAIGMQGAQLATHALAETARGLVDGDTRSIEERIRKRADGIRGSARALCDRLPALLESQKALAAAMPEFAPYVDSDRMDIRECKDNVDKGEWNSPGDERGDAVEVERPIDT